MGAEEEYEVFTFLAYQWDVAEGWEIAGERFVETDITGFFPLLGVIDVNEEYAKTADMDGTLLAVEVDDLGFLVIDGWHKLWRAKREGRIKMRVAILTRDEERTIRLRGGNAIPRQPKARGKT